MEGFLDRETDKKAIRGGFIEWGVRSTAQPKAPSREIYFAVSSRAAICSIEQETAPAMPNVSPIGDRDMYDNIPTEEQKQVNKLRIKYRQAEERYDLVMKRVCQLLALLTLWGLIRFWNSTLFWLSIVLACCLMFVHNAYYYVWFKRRFARKLSREERLALRSATADDWFAETMVKELESLSKAELLRASQATRKDDILLRAAAYTDETPKDQLLRPANPNDPNTQ